MNLLLGMITGIFLTAFVIFTFMDYSDRDEKYKNFSYIRYLFQYLIWELSLKFDKKEKTTLDSWGPEMRGVVESLLERGIKKRKAFKMMDEAKTVQWRDCIEVTFKDGTYEVYEHNFRTKDTWLNNDYLKNKETWK